MNRVFIMTRNELIEGTDEYLIAGLAMKVRNELGFCMLESAYERALIWELNKAGFNAERQVPVIIYYHGEKIDHGYCADIVVDRKIILELKAVTRLYAMHRRQLQSYLSASGVESGLLINFGNYQRLECERMTKKENRQIGKLGISRLGYFPALTEEEKKNPKESFAERIERMVQFDKAADMEEIAAEPDITRREIREQRDMDARTEEYDDMVERGVAE